MRIIGGKFRGKTLIAPEGRDIRPTSDRARGSLFDILLHRFQDTSGSLAGVRVADVFAGTGAMGLEALSRGASHVTFLDTHREALKTIRANAAAMAVLEQVSIVEGDALTPPRVREPCALVFLDPPYALDAAPAALAALAQAGWLAPEALCVVELAARGTFIPPKAITILDERTSGRAKLIFARYHPTP